MSSNIENIAKHAAAPYHKAKELASKDTCINSLGAHALYVAQIVTSVVALPFILLGGIATTLQALCTRQDSSSREERALKEIVGTAKAVGFALVSIPVSLFKAIVPDDCWNGTDIVTLYEQTGRSSDATDSDEMDLDIISDDSDDENNATPMILANGASSRQPPYPWS